MIIFIIFFWLDKSWNFLQTFKVRLKYSKWEKKVSEDSLAYEMQERENKYLSNFKNLELEFLFHDLHLAENDNKLSHISDHEYLIGNTK